MSELEKELRDGRAGAIGVAAADEIERLRMALEVIGRGANWILATDADVEALRQQLRMIQVNAKAALRGSERTAVQPDAQHSMPVRTEFQQSEDIRWLEELFAHYDSERIEWRKKVDEQFSESYEREWLRYRGEAEALRAGINALKRLAVQTGEQHGD